MFLGCKYQIKHEASPQGMSQSYYPMTYGKSFDFIFVSRST